MSGHALRSNGVKQGVFPGTQPSPLGTQAHAAGDSAANGVGSDVSSANPERGYPDWRRRLTRNLSRRSESAWEPLTYRDATDASDETDDNRTSVNPATKGSQNG